MITWSTYIKHGPRATFVCDAYRNVHANIIQCSVYCLHDIFIGQAVWATKKFGCPRDLLWGFLPCYFRSSVEPIRSVNEKLLKLHFKTVRKQKFEKLQNFCWSVSGLIKILVNWFLVYNCLLLSSFDDTYMKSACISTLNTCCRISSHVLLFFLTSRATSFWHGRWVVRRFDDKKNNFIISTEFGNGISISPAYDVVINYINAST